MTAPLDRDGLLAMGELQPRLWVAMQAIDCLASEAVLTDTSDLPAVRAAIQRLEVAAGVLVERAEEFRAALRRVLVGPPS